MHMLQRAELDARVSPRPIEHEDDLLAGTGSYLARKLGQLEFKDGDADRRRQMEVGATRGGMHKADEVAPGKAVLHDSNRPLSDRRPDLAEQRFQANAVLISCHSSICA